MQSTLSISEEDRSISIPLNRQGIKKRQVDVQNIARAFPHKTNASKQISRKYSPRTGLQNPFLFREVLEQIIVAGFLSNCLKSIANNLFLSDGDLELEAMEEDREDVREDETGVTEDDENTEDPLESVPRLLSNESLLLDGHDDFLPRNESNILSSLIDKLLSDFDRNDFSFSDFLLRFFLACIENHPFIINGTHNMLKLVTDDFDQFNNFKFHE